MIFVDQRNLSKGTTSCCYWKAKLSTSLAQKIKYATDLIIDRENTIPFFATSKSAIEFMGRYNTRDQMETEMMNSRWKIFDFSRQISNVRDIEPCPHCFSRMVAQGLDN